MRWESVQAFAGTSRTKSLVVYPHSIEECRAVIAHAKKEKRTVCPRGSGYTYGDMILNHGHLILNTSRMRRVIEWDPESGRMVVEPGVRFSDVFGLGLLTNWTLGACPGGMAVTIGGALSNNVHGKDSWKCGNFGDQVVECKLLLADGSIRTVRRDQDKEFFGAIAGGMGLLGVLTEITLQLRKVPSAYVEVTTIPSRHISQTVELLEGSRSKSDFSVAWVDAFARGPSLGRGFVTYARWLEGGRRATKEELAASLRMPTRIFDILPAKPTWRMLRPFFNPWGIKMVNRAMYQATRMQGRTSSTLLFTDYNFMHNKIPEMNQVYAPQGFLEFEPLLPRKDGTRHLTELLGLCQRSHGQSLLCAVKMHSADDYPLSFSGDGYSIGIDIQLRGRREQEVHAIAKDIFGYTRACGGKIYLAKDERLTPELFRQMYPRTNEFLQIKRRLDPDSIFSSDMFRRLFSTA